MNGDRNGEDDGQDVRRWLEGALAGEPPLSFDREQIVRQGRRKLRNRKLFQAGGAVTGVVAVVVGAVLVTGLVNEGSSIPPAAESTGTATVGPTTPTLPPGPSTTRAPGSSRVKPPVMVDEQARRLTAELERPGVLPADYALEPVGADGLVTFTVVHPRVYSLEADLITPESAGVLWVLVEKGPGKGATCDVVEKPVAHCEVREELGMPMTIAKQLFEGGEIRQVVRSVRPDGCYVTVTSSNLTSERHDKGMPPSPSAKPSLPEPKMIKIAALPELYVE